ncbi:MAG: hypothetical protein ABW005_02495 [Burkholderiaceae bacterium]
MTNRCPPPLRALLSLAALFAAALAATGCGDRSAAPAGAISGNTAAGQAASAPAGRPTDGWLGRWTGPEGTLLDIAPDGDGYALTIRSLDGPARFHGRAVGARIEFERAGKAESIRASSGRETGMKWLLDKKNCLTIVTGEGFCRD